MKQLELNMVLEYIRSKPSGEEIIRRYGDSVHQKLRDANWQIHKIDQHAGKLSNILLKDPFGKMLLAYLAESDPEIKALLEKKEGA